MNITKKIFASLLLLAVPFVSLGCNSKTEDDAKEEICLLIIPVEEYNSINYGAIRDKSTLVTYSNVDGKDCYFYDSNKVTLNFAGDCLYFTKDFRDTDSLGFNFKSSFKVSYTSMAENPNIWSVHFAFEI